MRNLFGFIVYCITIVGVAFGQDTPPLDIEDKPRSHLVFTLAGTWQGQSLPTSIQGVEAASIFYIPGTYWRYEFTTNGFLIAGLEVYGDEYVWNESIQKALPTQIEAGSEAGPIALVLGFIPSIGWQFEIPLVKGQSNLIVNPGLDLIIRLPIIAIDGSEGTETIGVYLNQNGKFLYPTLSLSSTFALRNGIWAGPWIKTRFPIARLWDGEELPFYDSLMVSAGLVFTISL